MDIDDSYHWRRQLVWGLVLVVIGVLVLLDRLGIADLWNWWHYLPLLLVVIGINRTIGYPTAGDFAGGLWLALIGIWLFATLEGMFGLNFRNSWPIVIIISGLAVAIKPIMARHFRSRQQVHHEKP
ncbi:LiaF transmembrane domain-containing protein [Massilia horti]|uniref:LiaF transmembrane domain-containing protein n=1 Tax=Massilia horti TaxID=2562153 RepID=A0A4Y9T1I4_9BURK|nr:DUF5668 domain-containing protein [Massilia horti]TFW33386.1 hypothetical protein E4O92_06975 [Massilia horti]